MGALGIAAILALLLEEVVAHEDLVAVEGEVAAVLADEVAAEDDLVEEVPLAVIEQGTLAHLVERVPPGVVEVVLAAHVLQFVLALQAFGHRLVVGVVVHVAHDDDLRAWVLAQQGFLEVIYLIAGALAGLGTSGSRGPVVHNDVHLLACQEAAHHEESAGDVGRVAAQLSALVGFGHHLCAFHMEAQVYVGLGIVLIIIRYEHMVRHLEEAGIVEQTAVHAAAVGPIHMDELVAALGQCGLGHEVGQRASGFHLGHTDDGGAVGQFVGTEFGEHLGHIAQFVGVLHRAPLVLAFGEVFPVVAANRMDGVEEVFEVVEGHTIEGVALLLSLLVATSEGGKQHEGGKRQKEDFLHIGDIQIRGL